MRWTIVALLLVSSAPTRGEVLYLPAEQSTFMALCEFCTPADLNSASPILVMEMGETDVAGFLAFDLSPIPAGHRVTAATLQVRRFWPDVDWLPIVSANWSQGVKDLTQLSEGDIPLPETPPAIPIGPADDATDHWDATGFFDTRMGDRVLLVFLPPDGVGDRSRYEFEGIHDEQNYALLPVLILEVEPATPTATSSIGRTKAAYHREQVRRH